jgi:hypothetical protein
MALFVAGAMFGAAVGFIVAALLACRQIDR